MYSVSVGVFAHNEEAAISNSIGSLLTQTLLVDPPRLLARLNVFCLANGCHDATAIRAGALFNSAEKNLGQNVELKVVEFPEGGKARTWNKFVHDLAPYSDYLIFMDGDIELGLDRCLEILVDALRASESAVITTDHPMKDLRSGRNPSARARLSQAASVLAAEEGATLCGQLYCAKGAFAQRVWMPDGLLVEDGFLRAFAVTDCFSSPVEKPQRILRVEGAYHWFIPYLSLPSLLAHEKRLMLGTAMNAVLFGTFWELSSESVEVSRFVEEKYIDDPRWALGLVHEKFSDTAWPVPIGLALKPMILWRECTGRRKLSLFFPALVRTIVGLAVFLLATRAAKKSSFCW